MSSSPRVIGYLRVSALDPDVEKTMADILAFAREHQLGGVVWVEEKIKGAKTWRKRELAPVVESLRAGDGLIVPELFRLGRSSLDILDLLTELRKKGVKVYALKRAEVPSAVDDQAFLTMVALFAEIDRDLVSARTREALKLRKAAGVKLGRPPGPGKSKLDPYRVEIETLLRNGSKLNFIARRYKISVPTLVNWIKKNKIDRTPRP